MGCQQPSSAAPASVAAAAAAAAKAETADGFVARKAAVNGRRWPVVQMGMQALMAWSALVQSLEPLESQRTVPAAAHTAMDMDCL
jgi:hypothetical protein